MEFLQETGFLNGYQNSRELCYVNTTLSMLMLTFTTKNNIHVLKIPNKITRDKHEELLNRVYEQLKIIKDTFSNKSSKY